MDRAEYQEKLEELTGYMNDKDYESALALANEIDWKRVKSIRTLNMVADVYEKNREYDDARRILKLALSRASVGRTILGRLVEISIKLGEMGDAEDYFDQFQNVSGNDNSRYVLQYKMYKAKRAPLDAQIAVLEEYREREYTEKWAYELASLYAKAGDEARCVEACDDLILWFGEGKYVLKAMELKMKYEPLTSSQRRLYDEERAKAEKAAKASAARAPEIIDESPQEMKDRIAESFQDVFSGIRREPEKAEEPESKFDNTVPLDQLHISDLEPERADVGALEADESAETIVSMPRQRAGKAGREPQPEEERVWTDAGINKKPEEELDLDSLLQETAGEFSREIRTGVYEHTDTEEKEEPAAQAEANIPELESEAELDPEAVIPQAEKPAEIPVPEAALFDETPDRPDAAAEMFDVTPDQPDGAAALFDGTPEVAEEAAELFDETAEEAAAEAIEEEAAEAKEAGETPDVRKAGEKKSSLWDRIRKSVKKMASQVTATSPADGEEEAGAGAKEAAAGQTAPEEGEEAPEVPPVLEAEIKPIRHFAETTAAEKTQEETPVEAGEMDAREATQAIAKEPEQRSKASSFRDSIRAAVEREEAARRAAAEEKKRLEAEEAIRRAEEEAKQRAEEERRAAEAAERRAAEAAERRAAEEARRAAEAKAAEEAAKAKAAKAEAVKAEADAESAKAEADAEPAKAEADAEPAAKPSEEEKAERELEEAERIADEAVRRKEAERIADRAKGVKYNEELEVPDPEPTEEEKLSHSHTLDLSKVGENTIPASLDEIIMSETPEERRIRFLHNESSLRMNDDQRKIFTYFARIPGMDEQILGAMSAVYQHADEHTSSHGNIAVMGAQGSGKSKLTRDLISAMCLDLGMDAAKIARITGYQMNKKDPVRVVDKMAGGFLMIEECSEMNEETVTKLDQAMDFRTDRMILIIEDEKAALRGFLRKYPEFAKKFDRIVSIPIFTNDELITFARTYAAENGYTLDDMAVLALYTIIGNNQSYEQPMTIAKVKGMIDAAMDRAKRGPKRKKGRRNKGKDDDLIVLQEKDFETN